MMPDDTEPIGIPAYRSKELPGYNPPYRQLRATSYPANTAHVARHHRPASIPAAASLALAILGVLTGWFLFGLPCGLAVFLGHIGLNDTRSGQVAGRPTAIAGLVIGYLTLGPAVVLTVMVMPAILAGLAAAVTPPATTPVTNPWPTIEVGYAMCGLPATP